MQCHRSGEVLPLPWHCIAVAVGELCHCNGITMPLGWQCSATAAGELFHGRKDVHIIYI